MIATQKTMMLLYPQPLKAEEHTKILLSDLNTKVIRRSSWSLINKIIYQKSFSMKKRNSQLNLRL